MTVSRPLAPGPVVFRGLELALLAGLVAGAVGAGRYLLAGFPRLAPAELAAAVWIALAAGAVFSVLFLVAHALVRDRVAVRTAGVLATAAATLPALLAAGYVANRRWALAPRDLLSWYGLAPNLGLVAGAVALGGLAGWLLLRAGRSGATPRWTRVAALAAIPLALQGASLAALSGPAPATPPVIVLLVDALRADELGAYGYARPTSPAIDALARDGVRFAQAISSSTFTKTSVASLFTGRHPYQHGVYWGGREGDRVVSDVLGPGETTLAETLRARGLLTTAWIQNTQLLGFMGFGQGFVDYHDQLGAVERIHRRLLPWLAGPGRVTPFFAYVHYIDLHDPYLPPPPWDHAFGDGADPYAGIDLARWGTYLADVRAGRVSVEPAAAARMRDLYDGQLQRVDAEIGRLVAELRATGLYDRSLIVVTSDHGDAFLEHGALSHSTTPYEELVHVPLIVKLPRNAHAGMVVESQVRHVDLLPTILDVLGFAPPESVAGCSLLPLLRDGAASRRDPSCGIAITEIAEEAGVAPTIAIRTARWKYIQPANRPPELYDLAADPGERHDLALLQATAAEPLAAVAREVAANRGKSTRIELSTKLARDLAALGYID